MMLPEPVWPVVVLAGISVALLGLVTTLALVLYFVVAVPCTSPRGTWAGTCS